MLTAVLSVAIFVAAFFAGELGGYIIEARNRNRWRDASNKMGLLFDGRKRKSPLLSRLLLPCVILPGVEESAFCYGESLKKVRGRINGFVVQITDFAVWDFHTRCHLAFRGILCVARRNGTLPPGLIGVVKLYSPFLHRFRLSRNLREYHFPNEEDFSRAYAVFGHGTFIPWVFAPDLRALCLEKRREIDCVWVTGDEVVVLWVDRDPNRFEQLAQLTVEIASRLADGSPDGRLSHAV